VRHEEVWTRLPDRLEDRDDPALLAHVSRCAACQRQVFLLGRIDRLLRDGAAARAAQSSRRVSARRLLVVAAAAAVAIVAALLLLVPEHARTHTMVLLTSSGKSVGRAVMTDADAGNDSLALTARGLPIDRGQIFVLWAGERGRSPMQVGRFMVDRAGGCHVRFNLPATHPWGRLWITRPGRSAAIVAST
jgi:hypothetical protein